MIRHSIRACLLAAVLLAPWCAPARADQLILKDGTIVQGKKVGVTGDKVAFMVRGRLNWYMLSDVHKIIEGTAEGPKQPPAKTPTQKPPVTPPAPQPQPGQPRIETMPRSLGEVDVRIDRPFKAGDVVRIVATGEEVRDENKASKYGVSEKSGFTMRVHLDTEMRIMSVDAAGRSTRTWFTISEFKGTIDDKPVEALIPGQIVMADVQAGKARLVLQAGGLDPQAERLLALVLPVQDPAGPADEEAYGTPDPRRVGQQWAAGKSAIAKALARENLTAAEQDVAGYFRAAELRKINGVPCVHVQGQAGISHFTPPMAPGGKVLSAKRTITLSGDYPVDPALPRAMETIHTTTAYRTREPSPDGSRDIYVNFTDSSRVTRVYTAIKWPRDTAAKPPVKTPGPRDPKAQRFQEDKVVVELPGAFDRHVAAGGGQYLIFQSKQAKSLAVVDVLKGKVVKEIPNIAENALLTAGADKFIVVVPNQKMVQRWNYRTFARERITLFTTLGTPQAAVMGANSTGPLLLWGGGDVALVDLETMTLMKPEGKVLSCPAGTPYRLSASADGKTFVGVPGAGSDTGPSLMTLDGLRTTVRPLGRTGQAGRFAILAPDGSLAFLPAGAICAASGREVPTHWPPGTTCFPTSDPSYFLTVRLPSAPDGGAPAAQVDVCTAGSRQVVFSFTGLDEMAPADDDAHLAALDVLNDGRAHFHYFPRLNVLATVHWDAAHVTLRKFDLLAALKDQGEPYLFVTSVPPPIAVAGRLLRYQIEVQTSAGTPRYKLVNGPPGCRVSNTGLVQWSVLSSATQEAVAIVVQITDAAGKELTHTIDLAVTNAP